MANNFLIYTFDCERHNDYNPNAWILWRNKLPPQIVEELDSKDVLPERVYTILKEFKYNEETTTSLLDADYVRGDFHIFFIKLYGPGWCPLEAIAKSPISEL